MLFLTSDFGLNSLRHKQGLLFGLVDVAEHFAHPATIPVEAQRVADSSF